MNPVRLVEIQNVRYFERGDQSPNARLLLCLYFDSSSPRGPIIRCRRGASNIMFSTFFISIVSCVLVFITWRNYQSAAFEYRIFDQNQNQNIYPVTKLFENAQPYYTSESSYMYTHCTMSCYSAGNLKQFYDMLMINVFTPYYQRETKISVKLCGALAVKMHWIIVSFICTNKWNVQCTCTV